MEDGNFVNMANSHQSSLIGGTVFNPLDAIVYSGTPSGTRLHFVYFVYFVPDVTLSQIEGADSDDTSSFLQVSGLYDWAGQEYDWYSGFWDNEIWVVPNVDNMREVNGGIMGTMGMAFQSDSGSDADVAAMIANMRANSTYFTARLRYRTSEDGDGTYSSSTATIVPTPFAAMAGFGLLGLTALRRRRGA